MQRNCTLCGREFQTKPCLVRDGKGKLCSRKCADLYRRMTPEKFWHLVDRQTTPDGCWLWNGQVDKAGYGDARYDLRSWPAHRLAWTLSNGPIADGIAVCHTCDVNYVPGDKTYRRCCRPDHLWLGTNSENMIDMVTKGRAPRGERNNNAVLTENIVRELRRTYVPGYGMVPKLAREYHVPYKAALYAIQGKTWKHVI